MTGPVHVGPDKAIYAYAEAAAQRWADELGRPALPGMFGENLLHQREEICSLWGKSFFSP